jgi:tetratricopeptide (TPR) repeat protein
MIKYMLDKLERQVHRAVALQQEGNLALALSEFEFVFEALRFYEELGYRQEVDAIRRLVLIAQQSPVMTLYFLGLILYPRRRYPMAAEAIDSALLLEPDLAMLHVLQARIQTSLGNLTGALEAYKHAQSLAPTSNGIREALFSITAEQEMPGPDYYDWLQRFHKWLNPSSYVEIGLGHGRSLALTGPNTRAIGIDPYEGSWERLNYICPYGPATLFPMTSDDFFAHHDLRKIIGQETFDLAFIDGLHLFDQVLKDFINLERYARKESVILIHDCLPIAPIVAEREHTTGFWTGDVWRIIPCLKTFRPDLKIATIPTKPSGLGIVTNLDATSTILEDNYDEIVRYYLSLSCPENFEQLRVVCNVIPADEEYILKMLSNSTDIP